MQSPQQNTEPDHLAGSTLYFTGAFLGAILGTFIGGLGGFFLPVPYYQITNPEVLKDGQWGMIYFLSIPEGLVIGLVLGIVIGLIIAHKIK